MNKTEIYKRPPESSLRQDLRSAGLPSLRSKSLIGVMMAPSRARLTTHTQEEGEPLRLDSKPTTHQIQISSLASTRCPYRRSFCSLPWGPY